MSHRIRSGPTSSTPSDPRSAEWHFATTSTSSHFCSNVVSASRTCYSACINDFAGFLDCSTEYRCKRRMHLASKAAPTDGELRLSNITNQGRRNVFHKRSDPIVVAAPGAAPTATRTSSGGSVPRAAEGIMRRPARAVGEAGHRRPAWSGQWFRYSEVPSRGRAGTADRLCAADR